MRRALPLIAAGLLLSGCSATVTAEPTSVATTPPAPETDCLETSAVALDGIQWGLDEKQDGLTATRAAAIVLDEDAWLVAAEFTGPGIEDGVTGVWWTTQDPTSTETEVVAYASVDAFAAEFSDYAQPNGASGAYPGVDEVRACLG